MKPSHVDVWWVLVDEEQRGGASDWALLDPGERERAARFRFERHRREFVVARAELRRILGDCTGKAPGELAFHYSETGKPNLASDPELHFSVSHSDGLAAYAITRGIPVGIDVERIRELPDLEDLASRYFSPDEAERIRCLPVARRPAAFLTVWVTREAIVKATGQGITALEEPLASTGNVIGGLFRGVLDEPSSGWTIIPLEFATEYVGAVALDGPGTVVLRGARPASRRT